MACAIEGRDKFIFYGAKEEWEKDGSGSWAGGDVGG